MKIKMSKVKERKIDNEKLYDMFTTFQISENWLQYDNADSLEKLWEAQTKTITIMVT